MPRTRYTESLEEKDKLVDDFITRGYKIKSNSQYSTRVKQKDYGDPIVHGFIFLFGIIASAIVVDAMDVSAGWAWLFAIGAIVGYGTYRWSSAEEVIIKVKEDNARIQPES